MGERLSKKQKAINELVGFTEKRLKHAVKLSQGSEGSLTDEGEKLVKWAIFSWKCDMSALEAGAKASEIIKPVCREKDAVESSQQ